MQNIDMFKILTDKLLEPPLELMKLVKMTLSLPHGQAGVESGFSNTTSSQASKLH